MAINSKTIAQFVSDAVAAVQGTAGVLVNTAVGSITLALLEAVAGVASWLQYEISTVLQTTRASTSSGPDLDSWMADYGLSRLPATFAQGVVTFARFTVGQPALIPLGAVVQTADGKQQFVVIADTANAFYVPSLSAYTVSASTASLTVLVQALTAGTAGNVAAGQIALIAGSIPFIDTVTNAAALTSGAAAEADAALRLRFLTYIASLAKGTVAAVEAAIESCGAEITYTITENVPSLGHFTVVVNPPSAMSAVATAVNLVRPVGTMLNVTGATGVPAAVALTLSYDGVNFVGADVAAAVLAACQALVNGLQIGQTLYLSRLSQTALTASAGVIDVPVNEVTINAAEASLTVGPAEIITIGSTSAVSLSSSVVGGVTVYSATVSFA